MSRPDGLYFSERKLWDECPQAHDVLARLARCRTRAAVPVDDETVERVAQTLLVWLPPAVLQGDRARHIARAMLRSANSGPDKEGGSALDDERQER